MTNYLKKILLSLFILLIISCKSKFTVENNPIIIKNSCDLLTKINDTVIINGKYCVCMEYQGFITIENDSCFKDLQMDMNFENVEFSRKFMSELKKMDGCGQTLIMTVSGVVKKNKFKSYGHLGSNNAELLVYKILDYKKVKFHKP
jgi:hypothetical protein